MSHWDFATVRAALTIGALVLFLMIGLPWAVRVWNETRRGVSPDTDTPEDLLTPLAVAYQSGLMSREEYDRIRASVGRTLNAGEVVSTRLDFAKGPGKVDSPTEAPRDAGEGTPA